MRSSEMGLFVLDDADGYYKYFNIRARRKGFEVRKLTNLLSVINYFLRLTALAAF